MVINRNKHNLFTARPDLSVYTTGATTSPMKTSSTSGSTIVVSGGGGSGLTDELASKLNSIEEGAQVNQNAYSKVAVGDNTIEAANTTDTITITTDDKIVATLENGILKLEYKGNDDLWYKDADGNLWTDANVYSTKEISAYGFKGGEAGSGARYLYELSDVLLTPLSSGQLLQWNGTAWVNVDKSTVGISQEQIADLLASLESKLDKTLFDSVFTINRDTFGNIVSILANANFYSIGELSAYGFKEGESGGGSSYLHELKDVTLTSLSNGQLLQWDGATWVNVDKTTVGISQEQLNEQLAAKVNRTIKVIAGNGLTGGGELTSDVTLSLPTIGNEGSYYKVTTDKYGRIVSGRTNLTIDDIDDLSTSLESKLDKSVFYSLFTINKDESGNIVSIQANADFYSVGEVSAYGLKEGGDTPSGGMDVALMWKLLAGDTKEQINITHLTSALTDYASKSWVENKGYLTLHQSLDGYATEQWVLDKAYITSSALNGYATQKWVEDKGYAVATDISNNYATKAALDTLSGSVNSLRTDFDNLNALLNDDVNGKINTWNEVVDFLDEYSGSQDLAAILSGMNTDIASRVEKSKFSDYFATEMAKWFVKDDTNKGIKPVNSYGLYSDTYISAKGVSTGTGGSGGGGTSYDRLDSWAEYTSAKAGYVLSALLGYDLHTRVNNLATAGYITASALSGYAKLSDIPTSLPASDVYSWAKAASKPSYAFSEITNKPTTLNGYGVTDFVVRLRNDSIDNYVTKSGIYRWSDVASSSLPDTAGYGNSITINGGGDTYLQIYGSYSMTKGCGLFWRGAVSSNTTMAWNRILDSSNYSSYALPLSGGTIRGVVTISGVSEVSVPLSLLTPSAGNTGYIRFGSGTSSSNELGYLGFSAKGVPAMNYQGVVNTLIHSGNIGSYALKIDGSNLMTGYVAWNNGSEGNDVADWNTIRGNGLKIISSRTNTSNAPSTYATALHVKGRYGFQLSSTGGDVDELWFKNISRENRVWKQIAFTDSNVASATKATQDGNGNVITSTYLPLSGGTMSGLLTIKSSGYPFIAFKAGDIIRGYYGFSGTGIAAIWDTKDWHTLIHSGNIGSQSVNYANIANHSNYTLQHAITSFDAMSINTICGWYDWGNVSDSSFSKYTYGYVATSPDENIYSYIGFTNSTPDMRVRTFNYGKDSGWKTIAFTDSNVASATKLQTARTIWGQSFDGTGNVSGDIHLNNSKIYWHSDNNNYYIDNYYDNVNSPFMRYMSYSGHIFMTGNGEAIRIKYNKNVLIGTTSGLDHSQARLQVYESSNEWGSIVYTNKSAVLSSHVGGYGMLVTSVNNNNDTYLLSVRYNDTYLTGEGYSALLVKDNGNILMGTTTDWGFNLASIALCNAKTSGYLGNGGGAFFGNIVEGYGTAIWTQGNGRGCIQQGRSDGNATNYHLCLQPLGGNVLIGTTSNNGAKLQVNYTSLYTGIEVTRESGDEASIGFKSDAGRSVVGIWGSGLNLWNEGLGTALTIPVSSNNVLIGTTVDNGAKLQVNGDISFDTIRLRQGALASYILEVETSYGKSWFGMMNTYACHIYTDAPMFYMDKLLNVPELTSRGNIVATGSVTAKSSSDYRLKCEFDYNVDYQERLLSLGKVCDFNYTPHAQAREFAFADDKRHTSVIWQDARKANITGFCSVEEDGYGTINPLSSDLIFTMVGAIQQGIIKTEKIEERVVRLEKENRELKEKINLLEGGRYGC